MKKLTENHPLKKKFNELEQFMNEKGISLEWDGYHLNFSDEHYEARIKDSESGEDISNFPYLTECKLVKEL